MRLGSTRFAAVLLVAALSSGCGYAFVSAGALPSDVETVRVQAAPSDGGDPLLTDALVRELRQVLRWRGRLRPVGEGERSDATLIVHLTIDRTRAIAFDEFDDVLDYQRTLAVDAELSRSSGAILWRQARIAASRGQAAVPGAVVTSSSAFQGDEALDPAALGRFDNVQLGEERRAAARDRVVRDLAETIYSRMTEGL
ncbi:MAG: hypothetical protein HY899_16460 [Deltaproteobacteria bacterium]|nr:hypothetical protein [Deltaproteobacteria bacterium]